MKKVVSLLLVVIAACANAIAQDNSYPDPLVFNGKVKEVKGFIVNESGNEIGSINPSFFTVSYDYDKGTRTIKTFDQIKKLHEWQSYEQKLGDESRVFRFPILVSLSRLDEYVITYDKKGNKTATRRGWSNSEKTVYHYDKQKRVIKISEYIDGKFQGDRNIKYDNDNSLNIEVRNAKGVLTAQSKQTKDEHGNTVKDVYKYLDDNEVYHTNSLTYKYDERGNFTSFTYYWDDKPQWSLHRDITYTE
ncbi:MAG: hypothetical protein JST82_11925 [Bacteroidetes bacterium]|nr:hypothetical protein [Bacteroidota bacterium]